MTITPEARAAAEPFDQRFVDRIIARAQNSMMSLGEPKEIARPYDLSVYDHPTAESVAILLVSAHDAKYDLVSLMCAAIEETQALESAELSRLHEKAQADLQQAVLNLAGQCGACAEIGFCGSTMHEHEDCVIAENARLRERVKELELALSAAKYDYVTNEGHYWIDATQDRVIAALKPATTQPEEPPESLYGSIANHDETNDNGR